jgi:hypothetical protein
MSFRVLRILHAPPARPEAVQLRHRDGGWLIIEVPDGVKNVPLSSLVEAMGIGPPEARVVLQAISQSLPAVGFWVTEARYGSSYDQGRWTWFARIRARDKRPLSAIRRLFSPTRRLLDEVEVSIESRSDGRLRVHILGEADARILNAFVKNLRRRGLRVEEEAVDRRHSPNRRKTHPSGG